MSANAKGKFADLKWEQLLSDKYMVETCFSKKLESFTAKEQLQLLYANIAISDSKVCSTTFSRNHSETCE